MSESRVSEFLDRISKLSPQRLALLADELNERLEASERRRRVPLAIVGIGCRLPGGVHGPEEFWKLLSEGVDAVTEVPPSRWSAEEFYHDNPDTPGKMATRWGGFIDDPDLFDPKFFGIAPAEAISMDPQQRMLLETTWEALEHAGIAPSRLAGTQTGVFVGICNGDYSQVMLNAAREAITPYFASGLSHAIAAGRISYVFGLQGPSLAIDTSCSASLAAVHLACQSLRLGECDTAIAGGVNLMLNPDITIALSQSRMMAPDGRCKAFSESANGFVRGEGCGVIVLKRLPDAVRDGNRILAVIRGSACNQDGRSSGLTAPNGPSQEAVIAAALSDAALQPDDVDVIETHGTGTALGDPIEAGALNAVFAGRSGKAEPLLIGSVKTNIGHLESAAGIAGLIKLVLSIQHGKIPASLHFDKPNSRIEWDRLPLKVPATLEGWHRRGEKRVGGVSSFGFSGTNVHVVVEEYLDGPPSSVVADRPFLFTLSAKTESALKKMTTRLHRHLADHPSLLLADVAHTLNTGRSHFEYRAAVIAASQRELLEHLSSSKKSGDHPKIYTGWVAGHASRVAFVFGGEQHYGVNFGRELYDAAPVFRESIQRCEGILRNDLEKPLTSVLYPEIDSRAGKQTSRSARDLPSDYRTAANFAVQYALAELWRARGIEPSAVLGYGVGEYVAASVAGVFSLEEGLRLAFAGGLEDALEFDERARRISYNEPRIHLIPNFDKSAGDAAQVNSAEYWLRRSDKNAPCLSALSALARENSVANIYIDDSAALQKLAGNAKNGLQGKWLASLDADQNACQQFLSAAASLYVLGCNLDMSGFYRDEARTISLPTYPFEKERYWLDSESDRDANRRIAPRAESARLPGEVADDEWIYDLSWEPKPLDVTQNKPAQKPGRDWIIFADESGVGDALHKSLAAADEPCEVIRRPDSVDAMASIFHKLSKRQNNAALEIVYLWGMDVAASLDSFGGLSQGTQLCSETPIHLIQSLQASKNAHLWLATCGAQATEFFAPNAGGAIQAMAWGVGRTFGLENPEQYRALIDLDPTAQPEAAAASLMAELLADNKEDQIAYRNGERLAPRLRRSSLKTNSTDATFTGLRKEGSYLLVGGLGGLGLRLARWAAEQHPGHLILLGRTGTGENAGAFAAERLQAIKEIRDLGVKVTVVEGNVASEDDMNALFLRFDGEFPPLRGVFHAATAVSAAMLGNLADEQIESMLRPKVAGTWVLHELTKMQPLDFFLVFSSTTSLLGAKGLAHYAAANQFLDAFAHYRHAAGLPMLAVNWGAWDVMRLASQADRLYLDETGILPMQSEKAFNLFGDLIASRRAQVMIANIDWDILKPVFEARRARPLLEKLGSAHKKHGGASVQSIPAPASLRPAIEMAPENRKKFIEAFVLEQAAQVLGFRHGEFPPVDVALPDIGLDSLMAVDLKNRLQIGLGQELPSTIVFDYPTVSGLVEMLETVLWAAHSSTEDSRTSSPKDEIRI